MESTPNTNSSTTKTKPNFSVNEIITIEPPFNFRTPTDNEIESKSDPITKVAEMEVDDNEGCVNKTSESTILLEDNNLTRF